MQAKTYSLKYDYMEIGNEFRQEILDESKSNNRKLNNFELNQKVEERLKYTRPRDYCLRVVLKMCYYLQKLHEKEIL